MPKDDRPVIGEISGVSIVEASPDDHLLSHYLDGDCTGEERIVCTCGWTSKSAPPALLDLDVHFAEVNGISYADQKLRTAELLRKFGNAWSDPESTN